MADPHGLRACDSTDRENESETDDSSSASSTSSSSSSSSNGSTSASGASSSGESDSEHESQSQSQQSSRNLIFAPSNGPLVSSQSNQVNDTASTKKASANSKKVKKTATSPAKKSDCPSTPKSQPNARRNTSPAKNQSPLRQADSSCTLTVDDLLPPEMEVIMSIGKIKKQKQRASFDRLANILKQNKNKFPQFETNEGIKQILQQAEARGLLQQSYTENGTLSYRELGPGVAIVAQIANRKNAAQLAATYNLKMSFTQESETKSEPSPKKSTPSKSPAKSRQQQQQPQPQPQLQLQQQLLQQPLLLPPPPQQQPPPSPEKQLNLEVKSSEPKKICGLCRQDGTRDSLITCSVCSNSGKCKLN